MAARTTVLVADALPLYAEALSMALSQSPDIYVFDQRPSNGPAVIQAVERFRPDVALVDFFMPDMDGPILCRSIFSVAPECKILMISWLSSTHQIQQALNAGAVGFLIKDCRVSQVLDAIRKAGENEAPVFANVLESQHALLDTRTLRQREDLEGFHSLTPREVEILALLNSGRSTKEIADRVAVSIGTVRNHISAILTKTETNSQIEAVAKARDCGFLKQ